MYKFLYNFASAKSDLPPHNTLYFKLNKNSVYHTLHAIKDYDIPLS